MVARPPTRMTPKRANGTDKVTTLGVMSRMTITSDGDSGMSLDDIVIGRTPVLKQFERSCDCRAMVIDFGDVGDVLEKALARVS